MFQRIRDWFTLQWSPSSSAAYEAATERRWPGSRARQAVAAQALAERQRQDREWWDGVVAMQEAGRVKEAEEQTLARIDELDRFVLDPFERIAMLHARDVDRLLAAGDGPGARAAANEALRWMSIRASGSTSGGEGTARSAEAARMDAELEQKLKAAGA